MQNVEKVKVCIHFMNALYRLLFFYLFIWQTRLTGTHSLIFWDVLLCLATITLSVDKSIALTFKKLSMCPEICLYMTLNSICGITSTSSTQMPNLSCLILKLLNDKVNLKSFLVLTSTWWIQRWFFKPFSLYEATKCWDPGRSSYKVLCHVISVIKSWILKECICIFFFFLLFVHKSI